MKTFQQTIAEFFEAEIANGHDFEVKDSSVYMNGSERYQVLQESEADNIIEDGKNYDGFPAPTFYFENQKFFFVLQ